MLLYIFLFIFYIMLIYLCFVLSLAARNSSAPVPRRISSSIDVAETDDNASDNLRKRRGFEHNLGLSRTKKNDSPIENNFVFLKNDTECTDNSMLMEDFQDNIDQGFEENDSATAKNPAALSDDELLHDL